MSARIDSPGRSLTRSSPQLEHWPALDGLRGMAVLGVMLFHAEGALRGGYLGVDLFFVLSGFLITGLLLREFQSHGRIDLKAFWLRRARRLLPALLVLLVGVTGYSLLLAPGHQVSDLLADSLATLLYVANWHALQQEVSYWALFQARSPLEHMWSLAVEEQFYLVWPLLVAGLLAHTRRGPRLLMATTLVTLLGSWGAQAWFSLQGQTDRAYLGTDTRVGAMLVGATLSMLMHAYAQRKVIRGDSDADVHRASPQLALISGVSALLIGAAWWRLEGDSPWLHLGGLQLTELACATLILCSAQPSPHRGGLVTRTLSWRPLRYVGTISYGLYLWHWPVDCVLTPQRTTLLGVPLFALQTAVTFALAMASFHWLETPIRSGRSTLRARHWAPAGVAIFAWLFLPAWVRSEPPKPQHSRQALLPPPAPRAGSFRVLLLGDSTANSLGWALRALYMRGLSVHMKGKDGCTLFLGTCEGDDWASHARAVEADATLLSLTGAFLYGMDMDGQWRESCYPPLDAHFEQRLRQSLLPLSRVDTQVWVATIPYGTGKWDSTTKREQIDCLNRVLRRVTAEVPNARLLDLAEQFCPAGDCGPSAKALQLRPDGVHLALETSMSLARWLARELGAITQVQGTSEPRGQTL